MGQKVNPIGMRLGINRTWDSRWYADVNYASLLHEDLCVRKQKRKIQPFRYSITGRLSDQI